MVVTIVMVMFFAKTLGKKCRQGSWYKATFAVKTVSGKMFTTDKFFTRILTYSQMLPDYWGHTKITKIRSLFIRVGAKVTRTVNHDVLKK